MPIKQAANPNNQNWFVFKSAIAGRGKDFMKIAKN
jgi:hypothetical protein